MLNFIYKVERFLKIFAIVIPLLWMGYHFWPKKSQGLGVEVFRELPVQNQGRIKPLDTVARTALLSFSGKTTLRQEGKPSLEPSTWLLIVATQPLVADALPVFRIDHPQLKSIFHLEASDKIVSYNDLQPYFQEFTNVYQSIDPDDNSSYGKSMHKIYKDLQFYHELIHSFRPFAERAVDTIAEYAAWQSLVVEGVKEIQKKTRGESYDSSIIQRFMGLADRYLELAKTPLLTLFPPVDGARDWANIGQVLLDVLQTGEIHPAAWGYATLAEAAEKRDGALFQKGLDLLHQSFDSHFSSWKLKLEVYFNQWAFFYQAAGLYIWAGLLVLFGWFFSTQCFTKAITFSFGSAFLLHTFGIIIRMVLQGRPPVTSLYASALFVGWAAVILAYFLEKFFKNGLGAAAGSLMGTATLIVAHHLSAGEDTLEMVRAVLDSNFWLSTHVICITLGYSAMFVSGGIAFIAAIKRLAPLNEMNKRFQQEALRMVYASLCFGILFSFIGTLLGGIWADQSWGRFWGWDPKENGALLIVLWAAFTLHARLGGIIKARGLLACAIFGNILTSWSWFGTNMLGVGLHSYGFMEAAFWALLAFIATQLIGMSLLFVKKDF